MLFASPAAPPPPPQNNYIVKIDGCSVQDAPCARMIASWISYLVKGIMMHLDETEKGEISR